MDKLTLSTPYHSSLTKEQRLKFTQYLSTKGAGTAGTLRITTSQDTITGVVLKDRPNGLSLTFNPSKFYHGKNFEQINLPQLTEVIEFISDYYQTNLKEWNVAGFDWCENITLKHPPEQYISHMGKLKAYDVEVYKKTGKTYHTSSNTKAVTLYNKIDEMQRRKEEIPPTEQGANILRIEVGINKAPQTIKHLSTMQTLNDYLEPDNYAKLPELWAAMFSQIETNETLNLHSNLTEREQTLVLYLEKFGWKGYRDKLRIDFKNSPKTLQRRLKELEALQNKMIANTPESLVKELEQKVKQISQQRKAEIITE
jgi:hypothetical protein